MIGRDEVTSCGSVLRSHGVDGEVVVPLSAGLIEDSGMPCLVLEMDGILVPFFIESFRSRGASSALVKFEGIDSLEQAESLRGKSVWLLRRYIDGNEEDFSPEMLTGLRAEDVNAGYIGIVDAVDDSTANVLFRVVDGTREHILPASPELVERIDFKEGVIVFNLPEGLLDM